MRGEEREMRREGKEKRGEHDRKNEKRVGRNIQNNYNNKISLNIVYITNSDNVIPGLAASLHRLHRMLRPLLLSNKNPYRELFYFYLFIIS